MPMVIAIDGPAASGKSSTAAAVAAELGLRHLDSGAFYRAITLATLRQGIPPAEWEGLDAERLDGFGIRAHGRPDGFRIEVHGIEPGQELRAPEVNAHVSRIAAIPAVRGWLLDLLREIARKGGVVADGRDIGTVVFPKADLKIFLVCEPEVRAERRLREQGVVEPRPEQIRAEAERLLERDRIDTTRAIAPLRRAPDAIVLDTTELTFAGQVAAIADLARERAGCDRHP